jgi:hypothetical protein
MFLAAPRGTVAVTGEPISSLACRGTRAVRQQALVMLALEHNLQELNELNRKCQLRLSNPAASISNCARQGRPADGALTARLREAAATVDAADKTVSSTAPRPTAASNYESPRNSGCKSLNRCNLN